MLHQGIILREGHVTRTIYNLIKDKRYEDVIECIVNFGEAANTRAGLSTLGYCYYHAQKYEEAASCYEQLCQLVPKESRYKFYYAQSLYQAGIFADALRILKQINEHDELKEQCLQLQSAILYSSEDYAGAQSILNQRAGGNADTLNDEGCLLYQADQFDGAVQRFQTSLQVGGFNALVAYNLALTHFRKKERSQAIDYTSEIVERGIRNHPELGIGAQIDTDGSARSVGNPITMAVSGITQALNLKAAIEYQDGNMESARDALLDLPPRAESELDPVTLHNMALTDTQGPVAGLRKLAFLLQLGPPACPKETFANILLICCKHEMYETAADILAEHTDLTYKYLSQYLYELLDALITAQTSAELAEKKLGTLASSLAGKLRSLAAKVQEVRATTDQQALRDALKDYEHALELYCVEFEVIKASKACHKLPPYNLMLEGDRITVRCDLEALIQDSAPISKAISTTSSTTTTTTHRSLPAKQYLTDEAGGAVGNDEMDADEDATPESNEDDNEAGNGEDEDDEDEAQNMLNTDSNESFEYKQRSKQRSSSLSSPHRQRSLNSKRSATTPPLVTPQPQSYHCRGEGLSGRTTRWSALAAPSCRGKWLRLTVGPPKKCNHAQFIFV